MPVEEAAGRVRGSVGTLAEGLGIGLGLGSCQ